CTIALDLMEANQSDDALLEIYERHGTGNVDFDSAEDQAALREALRGQERRLDSLEQGILPRARSVIADLQRAVNNRLLPLTDLIQARRTLNELFIQEADTYSDLFARAVDLLEEVPEAPALEKKL
ncbi:MAG: outer rane efflux protein, partial [Myxococcaceae bacterium]|nr:outer rane efflux protein [Myxococcaceae bacterium]